MSETTSLRVIRNTESPVRSDTIAVDTGYASYVASRALSDHMNGLAPDLPPLNWSLRDQFVTGRSDDAELLTRWAAALGLKTRKASSGWVVFARPAGESEGRGLEVCGIVDQAAWNAGLDRIALSRTRPTGE